MRARKPEPEFKVCYTCGDQKAIELFSIDSRTKRHRSPCRACKTKQGADWRRRNKDRTNEQARRRSKTEKVRAQVRVRLKRWRKRYPEKKRAQDRRRREKLKRNNQNLSQNPSVYITPPLNS